METGRNQPESAAASDDGVNDEKVKREVDVSARVQRSVVDCEHRHSFRVNNCQLRVECRQTSRVFALQATCM